MSAPDEQAKTPAEIDGALLRLAKAQGALDAELSRWILLGYRARIHRHFGAASFAQYLERRLGYGPRLAKDKVKVAEALEQLPAIEAALVRGARSWSTVRELVRVATGATEREWLAASEGKTVREVERQVSGLTAGDRPHAERDPLLIQHRRTITLTSDQKAILRDAELEARRALGADLSEGEIWAAIAQGYLGRGRRTKEEAGYQISLTICAECHQSWRPAGDEFIQVSEAMHDCACCDGELVGLVPDPEGPAALEAAAPEGTRSSSPRAGAPGSDAAPAPDHADHRPSDRDRDRREGALTHVGRSGLGRALVAGFEGPTREARDRDAQRSTPVGAAPATRVLRDLIRRGGLRAVLHETSAALGFTLRTVSPRLRQAVLARDHHACAVPGCRNATWVDLHHLRRLADGGPNHPDNLITLCGAHHAQHHAGYLGIEGTPSTGLRFHTRRGILHGGAAARSAALTSADERTSAALIFGSDPVRTGSALPHPPLGPWMSARGRRAPS